MELRQGRGGAGQRHAVSSRHMRRSRRQEPQTSGERKGSEDANRGAKAESSGVHASTRFTKCSTEEGTFCPHTFTSRVLSSGLHARARRDVALDVRLFTIRAASAALDRQQHALSDAHRATSPVRNGTQEKGQKSNSMPCDTVPLCFPLCVFGVCVCVCLARRCIRASRKHRMCASAARPLPRRGYFVPRETTGGSAGQGAGQGEEPRGE